MVPFFRPLGSSGASCGRSERLTRSHLQEAQGQDFASAFSSILQEPVKRDPILSQNQGFAGEIKKRKMEAAVERTFVQSRAELRNQWYKKPDPHADIAKERQMKRAATAGVVKLFNAITRQQREVHRDDLLKGTKAGREFTKMSKDKFLETLKGAGKSRGPGGAAEGRTEKKGAPWLQPEYEDEGDGFGSGAMDIANDDSDWE